jgi:hypothetical protein
VIDAVQATLAGNVAQGAPLSPFAGGPAAGRINV